MKARTLENVYVALLILVLTTLPSMTHVSADLPSVITVTMTTEDEAAIDMEIRHSSPTSTHHVDTIEVEINGALEEITDLEPQNSTIFTYRYNLGKVENEPEIRARARCTVHGWSGWAVLEEEPAYTAEGLGTLASVNLIVQISIAVLIVVGVVLVRKGRFRAHGSVMAISVAVNAIAILVVMGPSMVNIISQGFGTLPFSLTLLTIVHGVLGVAAEVLGAILVFRKFGNVKMWMRITFTLWMLPLALGILIYLLLYVV